MEQIRIYNSLSRKKESLPGAKKLRLFVCGPTVYDYAHIGHARTYIFFDFFAKYLRLQGHEVEYVENITDIDDKIIKRAVEENKKSGDVAKFFTNEYLEDMKAIGVSAVSKYAPATKFIPQIIAQAEQLIEKGFAYKINGDGWYFDIKKFPDYGKLSGRGAEQAEDAVSRIDESAAKRNRGDFCLWKFSKPDEPIWKSETIGDGRPGWHIEDTAISENYFGPQYEIHGGGMDLKFPHHEAEIAQQESASGKKPFVRIWMHTGTLLVNGQKMSKSLGNFVTIKDFLKKYSSDILRWTVLRYHYGSPLNYSEDIAKQSQAELAKIAELVAKLTTVARLNKKNNLSLGVEKAMKMAKEELLTNLNDDLGTPFMAAQIFSLGFAYQEKIWQMPGSEAKLLGDHIKNTLDLMGISIKPPAIPEKIKKLAQEREKLRGNKQFEHSDRLRKEVEDLGYLIEDTPAGPFIWPKS